MVLLDEEHLDASSMPSRDSLDVFMYNATMKLLEIFDSMEDIGLIVRNALESSDEYFTSEKYPISISEAHAIRELFAHSQKLRCIEAAIKWLQWIDLKHPFSKPTDLILNNIQGKAEEETFRAFKNSRTVPPGGYSSLFYTLDSSKMFPEHWSKTDIQKENALLRTIIRLIRRGQLTTACTLAAKFGSPWISSLIFGMFFLRYDVLDPDYQVVKGVKTLVVKRCPPGVSVADRTKQLIAERGIACALPTDLSPIDDGIILSALQPLELDDAETDNNGENPLDWTHWLSSGNPCRIAFIQRLRALAANRPSSQTDENHLQVLHSSSGVSSEEAAFFALLSGSHPSLVSGMLSQTALSSWEEEDDDILMSVQNTLGGEIASSSRFLTWGDIMFSYLSYIRQILIEDGLLKRKKSLPQEKYLGQSIFDDKIYGEKGHKLKRARVGEEEDMEDVEEEGENGREKEIQEMIDGALEEALEKIQALFQGATKEEKASDAVFVCETLTQCIVNLITNDVGEGKDGIKRAGVMSLDKKKVEKKGNMNQREALLTATRSVRDRWMQCCTPMKAPLPSNLISQVGYDLAMNLRKWEKTMDLSHDSSGTFNIMAHFVTLLNRQNDDIEELMAIVDALPQSNKVFCLAYLIRFFAEKTAISCLEEANSQAILSSVASITMEIVTQILASHIELAIPLIKELLKDIETHIWHEKSYPNRGKTSMSEKQFNEKNAWSIYSEKLLLRDRLFSIYQYSSKSQDPHYFSETYHIEHLIRSIETVISSPLTFEDKVGVRTVVLSTCASAIWKFVPDVVDLWTLSAPLQSMSSPSSHYVDIPESVTDDPYLFDLERSHIVRACMETLLDKEIAPARTALFTQSLEIDYTAYSPSSPIIRQKGDRFISNILTIDFLTLLSHYISSTYLLVTPFLGPGTLSLIASLQVQTDSFAFIDAFSSAWAKQRGEYLEGKQIEDLLGNPQEMENVYRYIQECSTRLEEYRNTLVVQEEEYSVALVNVLSSIDFVLMHWLRESEKGDKELCLYRTPLSIDTSMERNIFSLRNIKIPLLLNAESLPKTGESSDNSFADDWRGEERRLKTIERGDKTGEEKWRLTNFPVDILRNSYFTLFALRTFICLKNTENCWKKREKTIQEYEATWKETKGKQNDSVMSIAQMGTLFRNEKSNNILRSLRRLSDELVEDLESLIETLKFFLSLPSSPVIYSQREWSNDVSCLSYKYEIEREREKKKQKERGTVLDSVRLKYGLLGKRGVDNENLYGSDVFRQSAYGDAPMTTKILLTASREGLALLTQPSEVIRYDLEALEEYLRSKSAKDFDILVKSMNARMRKEGKPQPFDLGRAKGDPKDTPEFYKEYEQVLHCHYSSRIMILQDLYKRSIDMLLSIIQQTADGRYNVLGEEEKEFMERIKKYLIDLINAASSSQWIAPILPGDYMVSTMATVSRLCISTCPPINTPLPTRQFPDKHFAHLN